MQRVDLSLYQKRFWLEWQLNPASIAYNTPLIFEMHGDLHTDALSYALETFINHYDEGCRSHFSQDETGVKQVIAERVTLEMEIKKLTVAPELHDQEKHHYIAEITSHVFNLTKPPLYKFGLLSFSDTQHLLVLNFHHMITDAISAGAFIKIVAGLYNYYLASGPLPQHAELIKLSDYVRHEQETYTEVQRSADLDYWAALLADANLYLDLPAKRGHHGSDSKSVYFNLDQATTHQLKNLVSEHNTSIFILLAAIFGTILLRYSNQQSAVLNYPVNMRPTGFREKTGCFVNNVLFKIEYSPDLTFQSLLEKLTAERRATKLHQRCSLTDVVAHLREQSILTGQQFFNVDFYEAYLGSIPLGLNGVKVKSIKPRQQTLQNDLGLAYQPGHDEIQFKFEYKSALFDDALIHGFIEQFNQLIKLVIADIHLPLGSYPLLNDQEYKKLTTEWNQTEVNITEPAGVVAVIQDMAAKYPDHIAVKHLDETLTYQQLNAKANQLAQYLLAENIAAEALVGIYFERSTAMIISMLAVLKAGAAYIPLDPKYPQARIQHIVQDSRLSLILAQSSHLQQLADIGQRVLAVDLKQAAITAQSTANPDVVIKAASAAYVIYTSGSTGNPKGVVVSHHALFNHNQFARKFYAVSAADKVLQLSTINFDISVEEIFTTLTSGATLVLYPDVLGLSLPQFQKTIHDEAITILDLPTAFWHSWISELTAMPHLPQLRLVIVGGEQVNQQVLSRWNKLVNASVRWVNTYGPTEATIIATYLENPQQALDYVPIGRPIANSQAYITDANLHPVPVGVTGELLIGGDNLARCYLHQPALTAEKFIPDPFSAKPGSRLYRTGDLARYLADGSIEYVGRSDQQVKIRGYRVELGEIETALQAHVNIREAVVVVVQPQTNPRLAAYLLLKDQSSYQQAEMKKYLAEKLPDYMVPGIYILLDQIVLTSNGKIDKSKLPHPELSLVNGNQAIMPPKNDIEAKILDIWKEVLNREQISTEETFFDMGGHSLLLLKAHVKLEAVFQREIPIVQIFQHPTIKSFAAYLSAKNTINAIAPATQDNAQKQRLAFQRQREQMAQRKKS